MKKQLAISIGVAAVLVSSMSWAAKPAVTPAKQPPKMPEGMQKMMKAHENSFKLMQLIGGVRAVEAGKNKLNAKQAKSVLTAITAAQSKKQLDEATAKKTITAINSALNAAQKKEIAALASKRGNGMMMPPGGPGMRPNRQPGQPGGKGMGMGMGKRPEGMPPGGMMPPPGGAGKGPREGMGAGGGRKMPDMANYNPLKSQPGRKFGPGAMVDELVKALKKKAAK